MIWRNIFKYYDVPQRSIIHTVKVHVPILRFYGLYRLTSHFDGSTAIYDTSVS